jgi:hypothetical protein
MNNDNNNIENSKLTVAAIFIATYTTLIFTIPQVLKNDTHSFILDLVWGLFVGQGLLVDVFFFLYIVFFGFELSSKKNKNIPVFDIELTQQKIKNIKEGFFNFGVDFTLCSFSTPFILIFYKLSLYLDNKIGIFWSTLFWTIGCGAFFALISGYFYKKRLNEHLESNPAQSGNEK